MAYLRILDLRRFYVLKLGHHILAAVCLIAIGGLADPVMAQGPLDSLPLPTGPVILTVSGPDILTNLDNSAQFDLEMLEGLGTSSIKTSTIWTDGVIDFEGVPLSDLLLALHAKGSVVKATALNDYAVEIPLQDEKSSGALLAFRMNGKDMSPRDKGPIWVVYPYDSSPDFQTDVIYASSIWQLNRLEVLP
jgi:hypothetical protein